jgi:hypothetical protein
MSRAVPQIEAGGGVSRSQARHPHPIFCAGLLLTFACIGGQADNDSGERIVGNEVERNWSLVFAVGGAADTTFLDPLFVEVREDRVAVWDDGRRALLLFDARGDLIWQFGREGPGPGEFARVRDIAFESGGRLYVLDAGNGNLTGIADGRVVDRIPLGAATGMPDQMIVGEGSFRLLTYGTRPLVVIDRDGGVVAEGGLPHVGPDVHPLASQAVIAGTPDEWALAFVFGGGWIGFPAGDEAESYRQQLVEDPGFPEVELSGRHDARLVSPGPIVVSISVDDGTAYVQRYDRAEQAGFIDRFTLVDGVYQGSWRLPPEASKAYDSSVSDRFIALLKADPSPTLLVYRRD